MRLKYLFISEYKNLKNFTINFDNDSFIEVFVGKNGTGKSNFFESLIEITRHLYEHDQDKTTGCFDYRIKYEIDGVETDVTWEKNLFKINEQERRTLSGIPLPDNVLIYYSGHNRTVAELVRKYKDSFRTRIKSANLDEGPRFIGVGTEYKQLLLAILLIQAPENKSREYLLQRLGIALVGEELKLVLNRPAFANGRLKLLGFSAIDNFDTRTHYWGAEGITLKFLNKLISCIKGAFDHTNIYDANKDIYSISINIKLFQEKFSDTSISDIFRQFDNLKILDMLGEIEVPIKLNSGLDSTSSHFSDGQFQSIYIYSIVEIFKDKNCLTLLDEPDAFLHPEWQFGFLKQVIEITATSAKNMHVLMTSHSAVTLIPHVMNKIRFFDLKDNHANCYSLDKRTAINKLSSDLIKYSEQEQLLSIINAIQIENKPVLFTEGSTDPIIIKEAWYKLYDEEMPFIPFYAFSCTYINQLLRDDRIHAEMGGLPVFALFDFDKAYDQWNGLNGNVIENNPFKGLIKKWANGESFAFMLPIPQNTDIQKQVIKNHETKETFGGDSSCEIEHLFFGEESTASYFQIEPCVGGSKIVFKSDGDKTKFAKEVIPNLRKDCFDVFLPMFEFIKSKI
jgi:predicted ATPase